jgi:GH15 family glucan-1,4-alpha-glucosidase
MKKFIRQVLLILLIAVSCSSPSDRKKRMIADQIRNDEYFAFTEKKALEMIGSGFNAGDGYREVWIRDYNTFIELAAAVHPAEELRENLMVFFRMQGEDGGILDGFTPVEAAGDVGYNFYYTDLEPRYAGHKNTVETDQESSLVQAVYKYIKLTSDISVLSETVAGKSVAERLELAMQFLMNNRFSEEYGLIYGATTADWGDVQPGHGWGVAWDENTYPAIDIYDNAMFIIALDNLAEAIPSTGEKWAPVGEMIARNVRKHLWDEKNRKFIPHIYLEKGSPFPPDFDENQIYYFGGTAVAIEAGLLSEEEIKISLDEMLERVKLAGAASVGLTLYPPYPAGYFENKIMSVEYSYQNGGDWTWFGGRMIQQLINYGFVEEAYEQIRPMVKRVRDNDGFYEWYTLDNKPRGSGTFRGEAGVLYTAIRMLRDYAAGVD